VKEHPGKLRTSRGLPRPMRIGTARASRINRQAAKSGCARERGGWGRLSEDGPGQHNPDRSEGPWVERLGALARRCLTRASSRTQSREYTVKAVGTKDEGKPGCGKALSDLPALKPYRGKLAVRNFRGGDGNVGIIRSPISAIALPDNRYEAENAKFLGARTSDPLGPESCAATARDTVKRRQGYRRGGQWSCENIQPGRRRSKNVRKAT